MSFGDAEVMDWERVDPAIWWPAAQAWVVADRHLPDGTRQHMVRGHAPVGLVVANAQVIGEEDTENARFSVVPSHLSTKRI